ncbi:MAG: hypothetical protein ACOYA9_11880 [Bilifractor sp.]|jgi:hypothetical protein
MASSVIGNPSDALKALISGRMRFARAEGRLTVKTAEKGENGRTRHFRLRLENPSYDAVVLTDFALVLYDAGGQPLSTVPILEDRAPLTLRAWQHKTLEGDAPIPEDAAAAALRWADQRQQQWETPAVHLQ